MRATPNRNRTLTQLSGLLVAVIGVTVASLWDAEQQSQHAVARLALSQGTLARALVLDLDNRIVSEQAAGHGASEAADRAATALLLDAASLGPPRQTLVFVTVGERLSGPGALRSPGIEQLIRRRGESLELARDEAALLGLPKRRAVAAWRPSTHEGLGVLLIATAALERFHAEREQIVSIVTIVVTSLVVLGIGALAVRRDAERVRLEHELDRQRLERERDEQLARAERIAVASALSLGIAHELATPLSVIGLRVEGLRRHASDEKQLSALTTISDQVSSMKQVMQGFLSLARGDAPATVELSPLALARSASQAVMHRFDAAAITLELDVPDALPSVRADETLARQALTNLLINAAQASEAGGRVIVRARVRDEHLELNVVDEGGGIAVAVADQVTRPFFTTRADRGGSGLGLAITQEIARHHGGTVSFSPGPGGRGTEATFRLPLSTGRPS